MNWFRMIRDKLDMQKILLLRSSQYVQPLFVSDTVGAGLTKDTPLPLSTLGDFLILSFTGTYTALRIKALGVSLEDLGVCPLRMKFSVGDSALKLFGDFVPMDNFLTPGRVRVDPADPVLITGGYALAAADIGPVPGPLYNAFSYVLPLKANDTVTITVKNDFDAAASGWTNRWGITFLGIRARDIDKGLRETSQPAKRR